MTESEILSRLKRSVRWPYRNRIITGMGDYCAIYRGRGSSQDLLLTTDLLIEGTHFRTSTHRPTDIGHKTLARGLSDIASMGGEPRFCLLSLGLPRTITTLWIDRFYSGLLDLAQAHGAFLIGGDLARTDYITCDIVCGGEVPRGTALLRSGARPGDHL